MLSGGAVALGCWIQSHNRFFFPGGEWMITRQEPLSVPLSDSFTSTSITSGWSQGHCLLPLLDFWQTRWRVRVVFQLVELHRALQETRCWAQLLRMYNITFTNGHCWACSPLRALIWLPHLPLCVTSSFITCFTLRLSDWRLFLKNFCGTIAALANV